MINLPLKYQAGDFAAVMALLNISRAAECGRLSLFSRLVIMLMKR
jgi:hypothetical protein